MGAALLTGQKFRALCAFPVENARPLPVGRQEGPPAGARFPAWALKLPPSAALTVPSGRIWNPPLRPLRQPAAATSPGGERLLVTGGGVRGFACQRCRVSVGHRGGGVRGNLRDFATAFPRRFWVLLALKSTA